MHVSLPERVGVLVAHYDVCFLGVHTIIEIRRVGSSHIVYVVDDVPEEFKYVHPDEVYRKLLERGSTNLDRELKLVCSLLSLSESECQLLQNVWYRWRYYYGALTPLLLCDDITDVYLTSSGLHTHHVKYGYCELKIEFEGGEICKRRFLISRCFKAEYNLDEFILYVIKRVAERSRSPVTAYMPVLSVTDPELRVRFTISVRPISEPYVHIRILPRIPWTLARLVQLDAISISDAALLWYLADHKVPILIIGPMGSGKTSLANAIMFYTDPEAFKAVILDVDEIALPGHNIIKLTERHSYGLGVRPITKSDLIAHALRLGVEYIIVNEVRTRDEVKAWIDAVTTGHGGVTTFHAENLEMLKTRLENMLERRVDIHEDIAIVKTGIVNMVQEIEEGIRIRKKVPKVYKIYVPKNVEIHQEEFEIRMTLLSKMLEMSIEQQLGLLRSFYREPDVIVKEISSSRF